MAKRLTALGAAVAVLALVVSMVAPAASTERGKKVFLRLADLTEDDEQFQTEIDVDDNGFGTVGDYIVISGDPVYNPTRTTQVGVARGDCLFVESSATAQTLECDVTFDLARGLITVEGPITFSEEDFDPVQELAITGGTGAYRTARGELKIDLSDEEGFLFRFLLIL
jgi:allene oxide cyclase